MSGLRLVELIEGDNGKLSSRSVLTYLVTFTLCGGIIGELTKQLPSESIVLGLAGILSTLMGLIWGVGKVVDGQVAKAVNNGVVAPQNVLETSSDSVTVTSSVVTNQSLADKSKSTGHSKKGTV